MSARAMLLAAAALLISPQTAQAADTAFVGARLVIGDGSAPIENGTLVLRDGKVLAAGAGVAVPPGAKVIDVKGQWVTPGLVLAITDLGLVDVGQVDDSNDSGADKAPFAAALDIAPAINPAAQPIAINRGQGITRAAVAPLGTSAIFEGQGAVIDLGDDPQAVTQPRAFQYVELGEDGARLAGGSRIAAHAVLRNALEEARELAANPAAPRRDDVLLTRRDAQALIGVVTGKQPLFVHVERAADIRMALALRSEFPALKLVLVGVSEGWMVAKEIAAAGVPVLASPLNDLPARFEMLGATQSNVGRMVKAGVKVGLSSGASNSPGMTQYAGNLVGLSKVPGASGLTWGQAFAAITSTTAEVLGLGERFGSLRPGRAGDVVIWDGDPLEVSSGVVRVWIDGAEQSLTNHQTRLRDRYAGSPSEGALPKAYDR